METMISKKELLFRALTKPKLMTLHEVAFNIEPEGRLYVNRSTGIIEKANRAFCEYMECDEKYLQTKPFHLFVHPDDRAKTLAVADDLTPGKAVFGFINRWISKTGKVLTFQWEANTWDGYFMCRVKTANDDKL